MLRGDSACVRGFTHVRAYSRNPRDAEHAARTVRGHRAERARLAQLRGAGAHGKASMWARMGRTWRETPLKWTPIPIALGAFVILGVQAHRDWKKRRAEAVVNASDRPVSETGPWTMQILGALPLNAISRFWGWANSQPLPVWFRPFGFRLYAWLFGCNLDELAEPDLSKYESLAEFFSRELCIGARPISPSLLVSPADGKVLHLGVVEGDRIEQVKGVTYSLESLLGLNSPAHSEHTVPAVDGEGFRVQNERRFAELNGIQYSLWQLLGASGGSHQSVSSYLYGWAKGLWRWSREVVLGKRSAYQTLPMHPMTAEEARGDDDAADVPDAGDAGIPTSDSAENLGHYASVAMDMGTEALPLFTTSPAQIAPHHRLYFCVLYLAPGDYHRFHSPVPWIVEMRRHFRGELYSVSPYVARRLPNLFLLNERVALLGRWRHGFFSMTPIGATNVGSIQVYFDRSLRTNQYNERALAGTYAQATYHAASRLLGGQPLAAGDEMGAFMLGSTIVLVFEAPNNFCFMCKPGDKVRVGQALGNLE